MTEPWSLQAHPVPKALAPRRLSSSRLLTSAGGGDYHLVTFVVRTDPKGRLAGGVPWGRQAGMC